MTDPTTTDPEGWPEPVEEFPTETVEELPAQIIEEPTAPPLRQVHIQLIFHSDQTESVTYGSDFDLVDGLQSEMYAKNIAEIVERTALLHFGALPVLQKQEGAA